MTRRFYPATGASAERLVATVVLTALLLVAGTAQGQVDRDAARASFARGVDAYDQGAFADALAAFEAAYTAAPHPTVRVNIANCYEQLGQPARAWLFFQRFLAEAPDAPVAQRREVRGAVARLRRQIGLLRFQLEPEGATARVDGRVVGDRHLDGVVPVDAGTHELEVSHAGFDTETRELTVRAGSAFNVGVQLHEVTAPAPVQPPVAPDVPPLYPTIDPALNSQPGPDPRDGNETWALSPLRPPTVALAGASAATLIAAGVVGVMALGAESSSNDANARAQDPSLLPTERLLAYNQALSDASRAEDLSTATDVLGTVAALASAATVAFLVWDLIEDAESEEGSDAEVPAVTPIGTVGPQGATAGVRIVL